jgi:hypothetical protein
MEREPKDDPSGLIWLARALDEIELPESGDSVPSDEPVERKSPAPEQARGQTQTKQNPRADPP